jgi:hypothetical protein
MKVFLEVETRLHPEEPRSGVSKDGKTGQLPSAEAAN